ncbi:glycyl-radical enzyme activating protein [uncultured Anaerococcus sp.]|uniref:glycyl-radical enzyme activating protein n=1 Tax=uncultured Anaerococcus sp. TaxID=293428 RepID=UPI0026003694|nr:glycyl-radical enzyme activating protein [uncultured Anaerococcus sp.]
MNDDKLIVFNIQKFSLQDGPGIRTTIFLKGCPLRCKWCSNPESQNPYINIFINDNNKTQISVKKDDLNFDKDGYIIEDDLFHNLLDSNGIDRNIKYDQVGRPMSVESLVEIAMEDKIFYESSKGGITISGGEPLMQEDLLLDLLGKLKAKGIHTAIETTLFTDTKALSKFIPNLDLFITDCKHRDGNTHKAMTGLSNEKILKNLEFIAKNSKDYLVRIPVIPGFNYSKEDAYNFSKLFQKIAIKKVELLPFHQYGKGKYEAYGMKYEYSNIDALSDSDLGDMVKIFKDQGINAFV